MQSFDKPIPGWLTSTLQFVAFLIICKLASNSVLNHFYWEGGGQDSLMFSTYVWRSDWMLPFPPAYETPGRSFFEMHATWFFWIPTFISHYVNIDRIPYFALFNGIGYGLLAYATTRCLNLLWPSRQPIAVIIKILAGMAFSLHPNLQHMLWEVHFEVYTPVFMLLFLVELVMRRYGRATLYFLLLMGVREDNGLHLFGLMFLVLALDMIRRVPRAQIKPWVWFCLIGLLYSVFVLVMKQFWHIGENGLLTREYIGEPPYAHLSWELLAHRLEFIFTYRTWVWLPGIVVAIWAWHARNPYILAGFVSTIPWFLFSFFAKFNLSATFDLHYGFPFIAAGIWPFLAASTPFMESRAITAPTHRRRAPVMALLLIALHLPTIDWDGKPGLILDYIYFRLKPEVAAKPHYDELELLLANHADELRQVRMDFGVRAIAPYALRKLDHELKIFYLDEAGTWQPMTGPETGVDAVMYFPGGIQKNLAKDVIAANNLTLTYRMRGTSIRLNTNFPIEEAPSFASLFVPEVRQE